MKMQSKPALVGIVLSLGVGSVVSAFNSTGASYAARRGGQPIPNGTPHVAKTPRPKGTPTPRPTPVPGARDIDVLEGALGRTLTTNEKAAITAAATTRDAAIKAAITSFETDVAGIFDLTSAQLQAKIATYQSSHQGECPRDLASLLAKVLGRALTSEETAALTAAGSTHDVAIEAAIEAYRESAATALGLTIPELDAKVKAYLDAHHGNRGGHDGNGGHHGNGGRGHGGPRGEASHSV